MRKNKKIVILCICVLQISNLNLGKKINVHAENMFVKIKDKINQKLFDAKKNKKERELPSETIMDEKYFIIEEECDLDKMDWIAIDPDEFEACEEENQNEFGEEKINDEIDLSAKKNFVLDDFETCKVNNSRDEKIREEFVGEKENHDFKKEFVNEEEEYEDEKGFLGEKEEYDLKKEFLDEKEEYEDEKGFLGKKESRDLKKEFLDEKEKYGLERKCMSKKENHENTSGFMCKEFADEKKIEHEKLEEELKYSFSDIKVPERIKRAKFVRGYVDNKFLPDNNLTHAEAAQMLFELLYNGEEIDYNCLEKFDDVEKDAWYTRAIAYLTENNFLREKENKFYPDEKIKYIEAERIIFNVLSSFADSDKKIILADSEIDDSIGIIDEDKLNKNITRAEIVELISKVFGLYREENLEQKFIDVDKNYWAFEVITSACVN